MLAAIELSWNDRDKIQKDFTKPKYKELADQFPCLKLPKFEKRTDWYPSGNVLVDEDELENLTKKGFEPTLKKVKGVGYSAGSLTEGQLKQPFVSLISVANVGLFSVQKIIYIEDACTDSIQDMLNDGWRIVAVCPPPTIPVGQPTSWAMSRRMQHEW